MKIADFFLAIGIDVTNEAQLEKLDRSLGEVTSAATKLLAGFGSLTAGMTLMLHKALGVTESLRQFNAVTGLSTQELQKWQYAAKLAGVEGEALVSDIKTLQRARVDIMMGTGNVAPWQLLGIAPSVNPFDTLRQLKDRIKDLDPAVAASILGQAGLGEGTLAFLRLTNAEFDKLEQRFVLTQENQKTLQAINYAWSDMFAKIGMVKDRLVAALAPVLVPILKGMTKLVEVTSKFVDWLNRNTVVAKVARIALVSLAAVIGLTTGALTALITVVGLLTGALAAVSLAMAPLGIVFLKVIAFVALLAATMTAAVLVVQDFWVAIQGGKSLVGEIQGFKQLIQVIRGVIDGYKLLYGVWWKWTHRKDTSAGEDWQKANMNLLSPEQRQIMLMTSGVNPLESLNAQAIAPSNTTNNSSRVTQEINIPVTVQGGEDAYHTGKLIGSGIKDEISAGAFQLPTKMR